MIEIRPMELDDLEQVMEIEEKNFSTPWTETGFFSFLIRNDTLFLVAEENGKILGYIGSVLVPDEGDITNVSVDPSRQKEGIGKSLIRSLISAAAEEGVTKLYLEVRAGNAGAIHVYETMGFVQNGLRKGYYESPTEDAVLMMYDSSADA